MKALTICAPYPALIFLPDDHPHKKRVENRTWHTSYRGPLLIHTGKSTKWLGSYDRSVEAALTHQLGMIVGIVELVDCVPVVCDRRQDGMLMSRSTNDSHWRRHPWLLDHRHAEGPYCHIYANVRPFQQQIPYRGAQGLFEIPMAIVAEQMERIK